jgi:hypothetical protein
VAGRIFFEQVIHDNLDLGRPDHVGLVFNRRIVTKGRHPTPSRFRTRVITAGVVPSLHVDFKHSKIKLYHKEGRALRTETTINDTVDFGIRKGLNNLPALREVGFSANRRLLGVQRISHDPIIGADTFAAITNPVDVDGQHAAALRFGDPRAQALLATLLAFRLQPNGFTNRDLRNHVTGLLAADPNTWPAGRATHDDGYACMASSSASPEPTATRSPKPAYATPCSSPASTTGSSVPDPLTSPTPTRRSRRGYAPPTAPTTKPSTASPERPDSQPETQQPQHITATGQQNLTRSSRPCRA